MDLKLSIRLPLILAAMAWPVVADQTLNITLQFNGLAHMLNTGPQVKRYNSMGGGSIVPFGSATYALSGDIDPSGQQGLNGVLTASLSGSLSGFELSFNVSSFTPPKEDATAVLSTSGELANGSGDLAGITGTIQLLLTVKQLANAADLTISGSGTVTMKALTGGPLSITTGALADAVQSMGYSQSFAAGGGTPPM